MDVSIVGNHTHTHPTLPHTRAHIRKHKTNHLLIGRQCWQRQMKQKQREERGEEKTVNWVYASQTHRLSRQHYPRWVSTSVEPFHVFWRRCWITKTADSLNLSLFKRDGLCTFEFWTEYNQTVLLKLKMDISCLCAIIFPNTEQLASI